MREIKFRAWYKDVKRMCSYSEIEELMSEPDGCHEAELMLSLEGTWCIVNFEQGTTYHAGDRFDIMQYTGLKDKNGKEIYEGDILSFDGNLTADDSVGLEPNGYIYDEDSKHSVVWDSEQACWSLNFGADDEWKYKRDTHALLLDFSAVSIIGNIYENPELVKP